MEQIIDKSFELSTKEILKATLEIYKYIDIDINGEQFIQQEKSLKVQYMDLFYLNT